MMTFRPGVHTVHGNAVIEVWWDTKFIATICAPPPGSDVTALTIVSKYLDDIGFDTTMPPAAVVVFDLEAG
jgi:hypothetical protein